MPARLFCKTGECAGLTFHIDDEARIGRLEGNDVRLYPNVVSGRHARLYFDPEQRAYFLEDLGSRNGTQLDGMPVAKATRLEKLHIITFADDLNFIFQILPPVSAEEAVAEPQKTPEGRIETVYGDPFGSLAPAEEGPGSVEQTRFSDSFAPTPSLEDGPDDPTRMGDPFATVPPAPPVEEEEEELEEEPLGRTQFGPAFLSMPDLEEPSETRAPAGKPASPSGLSRSFRLRIDRPNEGILLFDLVEGENVVGRATDSDVVLPDQSTSRRHALLIVRAGTVTVRDLGTKNGTYLNGRKVSSEEQVAPGSTIRFGFLIEATLEKR